MDLQQERTTFSDNRRLWNGQVNISLHLAASLAKECLQDSTKRVPILVPLGEIVDDQTIDGLVGKVLASQHRVGNYHFHLFRALNRAGRLLVIFDGLDEMKHGMTFSTFEQNMGRLLELDDLDSRILVLGRDTVFQHDIEFKAIVEGRQITAAGRTVRARGRRELRHVTLRGFEVAEARSFVEHYFPVRARDAAGSAGRELDNAWVTSRRDELLSGRFDELIVRPVHAQMLCEIATDPEIDINSTSTFDLYDSFIHYLIDREVHKPGRYPNFTIQIRRAFNAAVAWWLWERGNASTTTLGDVPIAICTSTVGETFHDFDEVGLKRELTTGCLVEKGGQTIYFGHRSLQEFLVAEHLYAARFLEDPDTHRPNIGKIWPLLTSVIGDFLLQWLRRESDAGRKLARSSLGHLEPLFNVEPNLGALEFFSSLIDVAEISAEDRINIPWYALLSFFRANGGLYNVPRPSGVKFLAEAVTRLDRNKPATVGTILYLAAFAKSRLKKDELLTNRIVDILLPLNVVAQIAGQARRRAGIINVERDKIPGFWCSLRACRVVRDQKTAELLIEIDLQKVADVASPLTGIRLDSWDLRPLEIKLTFNPNALYRSLLTRNVPTERVELVRTFFNDDRLRSRIRPLVVSSVLPNRETTERGNAR